MQHSAHAHLTIINLQISHTSQLSEQTIWAYFIQICLAVKALHQQNILHRDLKPQNVFLSKTRRVKLGDLGCSKLLKGLAARTQCGTPYYMSPELWQNRPYGKKTDSRCASALVTFHLCSLHSAHANLTINM
jgi:NIMA (never in mitosis gene a)-related kinase